MRVLVNCHSMPLQTEGAGGAGKYVKAMLRTLVDKCELRVVCAPRNVSEYSVSGAKTEVVQLLSGHWLARMRSKFDVYYDPQNGLNPKDIPGGIPTVVCVHDLQHRRAPQFFSPAEIAGRDAEYGFAIQYADGLVAISEWEKKNLENFYGRKEVQVIPHGAYLYEAFRPLKRPKAVDRAASDFYIYPAVGWPHKNHYRLIQAFVMFLERSGLRRRLILTGTVHHVHSTEAWLELLRDLGAAGSSIEVAGLVSDQELSRLFTECRGMLFPSLYEGFGIPILDAMRYRCPVLASRLAAIPEVGGSEIEYFEKPYDSVEMSRDIERFDSGISALDEKLNRAERRAEKFSVEGMAERLLKLFERVRNRKAFGRFNGLPADKALCLDVGSRITIFVDTRGHDEEDIVKLVRLVKGGPLFNELRQTVAFVIVIDMQHSRIRDFVDREEHAWKNIFLSYVSLDNDQIWIKSSFEGFVGTDYCLFVDSSRIGEVRVDVIRKALAYMNYFRDVSWISMAAVASGDEILVVSAPTDLKEKIERFLWARGQERSFYDIVFRVSVLKEKGVPGSTAFWSYLASEGRGLASRSVLGHDNSRFLYWRHKMLSSWS